MNHFGIAFGVIVATVVGGAVLLDHRMESKEMAPLPGKTVAKEAPATEPVTSSDTAAAPAPAVAVASAPASDTTLPQPPATAPATANETR